MLLYALNHLSGYKITIEDLKKFRDYPGITPGHPEYGLTDGVETTAGPYKVYQMLLVAMAETHLSERFNREGLPSLITIPMLFVVMGTYKKVAMEAMSLAAI